MIYRRGAAASRRSFQLRRAGAPVWARGWFSLLSTQQSARVVVDELVEGLRLRVGVLQHPQEVLEQHDLAADDDGAWSCRSAGAVDEGLEQRVAHEVLGDEVPAARLADVDRVQALGHLVRAVERRALRVAGDDVAAAVVAVVVVSRWRRRRAGDDAARRVPPLDHAPELAQPALRHCCLSPSIGRDGAPERGRPTQHNTRRTRN